MSTKLEARAPRTRCYKCGSTVLFSSCHHCGRVMCRDDSPLIVDHADMPISKEFSDLGLEKSGPYHCVDCMHIVKGRLRKVILAGVIVVVIGVLSMGVSVGFGLVLIALGAGLAIYGYVIDQKRLTQEMQERPPLPLVPHVDSVRVLETLRGRLVLDQHGNYKAPIISAEGELVIALTLGRPDRDRLERYRKKYRLGPGEDVNFSAGLAVLRGPVGLKFINDEAPDFVIPLTGQTKDNAFLRDLDGRTTGQWNVELRHQPDTLSKIDSLPIWLTPSMVPESDQRTLELELQWVNFGSADATLLIDRVDTLEIRVPISWGNVESASGRASVGRKMQSEDSAEAVRTIKWTQLALDDAVQRERRIRLSVRFEDRIEMSDVVRGELEAVFKGALSGLQGVDIYHPLGERRLGKTDQTVRTKVVADFEMSLAGIRYQDVRVVPDRKRGEDAGKSETEDFIGVVPDHETVIDLTNEMSDQGYYVKRVIENPPRGGGRANVANRYWDIAGRRYRGVYPVDFHVILTGEEVYQGDIRAQGGNTKIRITVQGAYATSEMEERIEQEWERLRELTVETLRRRPRAVPLAPVAQQDQMQQDQMDEPDAERDYSDDYTTNGSNTVHKRFDELTQALLDGRISEDTYREIRARSVEENGQF